MPKYKVTKLPQKYKPRVESTNLKGKIKLVIMETYSQEQKNRNRNIPQGVTGDYTKLITQ